MNLSLQSIPATARGIEAEYCLWCDADSLSLEDGLWRFELRNQHAGETFEAEDRDSGDLNRLHLLAAVRGLEAIEGPADVVLMSQSRYLVRSLSDSLPRWRAGNYSWEHFGRRVAVQHADLWRRIDHALGIHQVEACLLSRRRISQGAHALNCSSASDEVSAFVPSTVKGIDPAQVAAADLGEDHPLIRIDRRHATGVSRPRISVPRRPPSHANSNSINRRPLAVG
ncbi:MAG: ribonuclease HI [Planctomycetota bacterium]